MPPLTRRARGRRVAIRGRFLATNVARLGPHLRAMEASLARILRELFDGTVAGRLVLHHDPFAGPGVAVAPGPSLPRGTVVGLYFGDVVESASIPRGEYVLGLGRVWRGGRVFRLNIDASRHCCRHGGTAPDLCNAAIRALAWVRRCLHYSLCGGGRAPSVELRQEQHQRRFHGGRR